MWERGRIFWEEVVFFNRGQDFFKWLRLFQRSINVGGGGGGGELKFFVRG